MRLAPELGRQVLLYVVLEAIRGNPRSCSPSTSAQLESRALVLILGYARRSSTPSAQSGKSSGIAVCLVLLAHCHACEDLEHPNKILIKTPNIPSQRRGWRSGLKCPLSRRLLMGKDMSSYCDPDTIPKYPCGDITEAVQPRAVKEHTIACVFGQDATLWIKLYLARCLLSFVLEC